MKLSSLRIITQASLGTAALLVIILLILITTFVQLREINHIAGRISDLRLPTVNASNGLNADINKVLANLRGWILHKDEHFILERRNAWKSIRLHQNQLQQLSPEWTNPENTERLKLINDLLDQFESSQDKTELLAWSTENLPASKVLLNDAIPRTETIFQQISKIMDSEKYAKINTKRKELFSHMAEFQSSFAIGISHIRAFLINADSVFIERFKTSWATNTASYKYILKNKALLDSNQKKYLALLTSARDKFSPLPQKIFEIRQSDKWNLATYELTYVTTPLGGKLQNLLTLMAQNQNKLLVSDTNNNRETLDSFITELWWLTLFAVAITILVAIYMRRNVDTPLNSAIEQAIELAENISSGQYLLDKSATNTLTTSGSSYETRRLLDSLQVMTKNVSNQARQLLSAKESAEKSILEVTSTQEKLKAQKNAMDQHSLVSITDVNGIITYVNDKFCAVSGYSSDELLGQNHRILNSKNQPEEYWRDMYLTCAKEGVWSDQVRNKAKDGHFYWVDTTIVALYDDNLKVVGYTSIRTDISESKEQAKRLRESQIAAEAATVAKTQFLATMSHEIRTPMNGVIGMTELLSDTPLNDEQKDYIETISRSGNSLLSIINDILDFSKLDANMTTLESITFDLEKLCIECLELVSVNNTTKDLEFIFDYQPDASRYFIGDPTRLRQVIINLLGNAVKFTHKGFVRLGIMSVEDIIKIAVEDSGIGLKKDAIDKLFSEFTQADSTTTREYGGTGLGLSISHKIIKLMNGKITVDSVFGEGTTFTIQAPLQKAPTPTPLETRSLQGVSILFIDNHSFNQRIFKRLLEHMKASVTILAEPSHTLATIKEAKKKNTPFEIIIIAHDLITSSGFELGVEIRKDDSLADTKLLIFSSRGQKGDASNFSLAGFNAYLNKFCRYDTLRGILSAMLNHDTTQPIITQRSIEELQNTESEEAVHFEGKALLAEDVLVNQIIAEKLLISVGLSVDIANNGQEALDATQKTDYDLIFMDCRMPLMDGYEATKNIRVYETENRKTPVPIIALTANASTEDRILCKQAGMNEVITKPFKRIDLKNCLRKFIIESVN